LVGVMLALAGCAKSPESIAPAYVSPLAYKSYNCDVLTSEHARVTGALASASAQQEKARGNDIAGVILLGLPVSTLSGDNVAPQVAQLKGEKETLEKTMIEKSCKS